MKYLIAKTIPMIFSFYLALAPQTLSELLQKAQSNSDYECALEKNNENVPVPDEEVYLTDIEKEVFTLVNKEREKNGLNSLLISPKLCEDADLRALEISELFSHTRPNGLEWWTIDEENAYGENLATGYFTSQSVMAGWMDSQLHKENILFPDFKTIGISSYQTADGFVYWVQLFGY